MTRERRILWMVAAAIAATVAIWMSIAHWRPRSITIQGAVIRRDKDDRRELPIADAEIIASDGTLTANTHSDASGYFKLTFPEPVLPSQTVMLKFRREDYEPLDIPFETSLRPKTTRLQIAAMVQIPQETVATSAQPMHKVSNIRIRYTVNTQADDNIGTVVKAFQSINTGNVPCNRQALCSPDGKWKASSGSISLDAGEGNEFRNVRVSCVAGPCPFTHIDASGFEHGGRNITASALDWSNTATFLLEGEVFHTSINASVRESYPMIFGRALNFTLPPTQEGVSIEADLDGSPMVFPLGPELYLSWATCIERANPEEKETTLYRCELKPGYQF